MNVSIALKGIHFLSLFDIQNSGIVVTYKAFLASLILCFQNDIFTTQHVIQYKLIKIVLSEIVI